MFLFLKKANLNTTIIVCQSLPHRKYTFQSLKVAAIQNNSHVIYPHSQASLPWWRGVMLLTDILQPPPKPPPKPIHPNDLPPKLMILQKLTQGLHTAKGGKKNFLPHHTMCHSFSAATIIRTFRHITINDIMYNYCSIMKKLRKRKATTSVLLSLPLHSGVTSDKTSKIYIEIWCLI